MMIFRFLGFSGRGLSLKLLVFNTELLKIWNGAEKFYFVGMLYMDDGIPVNFATFADEETWLQLVRIAGRTFSYMDAAGGFAEAVSTELCKGVELDCAGTYPREIILVFHWQFNTLMFLALHHFAHAARAMFLEAAVLLIFISEISLSDTREKRA